MKAPEQKTILVVAESIDVEDSSGSKANVALILNLAEAGFMVKVYHFTRKEVNLQNIHCFSIHEKKWNPYYLLSRTQRKLQHGLKINLAKYFEPWFGFSFTFFNDSKSISEGIKETTFDPDLVLTLSKGASFRPHHALLALPEFHDRWLAYIHDPYPFHFYPEPYTWSEPGFEQRIKFFGEVAKKCRYAAFPSYLLQEWMEDKYPDFKGKGMVIPHQMRESMRDASHLPTWFDRNRFILLHAGNLMKQRPPHFLIQAYQKFLERNPSAMEDSGLMLVGNASYYEKELASFVKQVPQLTVAEYCPFEQVQEMQKAASVNIILESKAEFSPFLPGKFPHCIAAERPILLLGPSRSESRRLLGEAYRYWSEIDDVACITALIEELYKKWKSGEQKPDFKRKDLWEYLSKDSLRKELDKKIFIT